MIVVCMVCRRQADIHREPVDDLSITHGLCARCNVESERLRGKPIERLKKDLDTVNDLKHHIREEMQSGVNWHPPKDEPDWKDQEYPEAAKIFFDELVNEVRREAIEGIRR